MFVIEKWSAIALGIVIGAAGFIPTPAGAASAAQIARGRYLVTVAGCSDCHTPGSLLGKPDMTRFLGGSNVGFGIPGLGVFVPPNLTPDKETGLGKWTTPQVVTAITTGKVPGGRILVPIMPYQDFAHLTHSDALAIVAYLRSLKPVKNPTPGPFGPDQKVPVFVMQALPASVYNTLPKPPGAPK
jgi:mono/diheme cytochrome c family protein